MGGEGGGSGSTGSSLRRLDRGQVVDIVPSGGGPTMSTGTDITDITEARALFPATERLAYFNTAAVGLASHALMAAYHSFVDEWAEAGLDYVRGEAAGERARA